MRERGRRGAGNTNCPVEEGYKLKILLAGLLTALTLGLFSQAAIQAAGDNWPNSGSIPPAIYIAGDNWPNGG